jgi:hypothetical protein
VAELPATCSSPCTCGSASTMTSPPPGMR